jgi:hypothetical protein
MDLYVWTMINIGNNKARKYLCLALSFESAATDQQNVL